MPWAVDGGIVWWYLCGWSRALLFLFPSLFLLCNLQIGLSYLKKLFSNTILPKLVCDSTCTLLYFLGKISSLAAANTTAPPHILLSRKRKSRLPGIRDPPPPVAIPDRGRSILPVATARIILTAMIVLRNGPHTTTHLFDIFRGGTHRRVPNIIPGTLLCGYTGFSFCPVQSFRTIPDPDTGNLSQCRNKTLFQVTNCTGTFVGLQHDLYRIPRTILTSLIEPVLRIRDIFVRIRIRGSVPLTNRFGSISGSRSGS
jgi:hypothetical protein